MRKYIVVTIVETHDGRILRTGVHTDKSTSITEEKQNLRVRCRQACEALTPEQRCAKAGHIFNHIKATETYRRSRLILFFAGTGWEVPTHGFIQEMLATGKRVALPYCKNNCVDLGMGEIIDFVHDVACGRYGIPEPVMRLRDAVSPGDLDLVICPGVAFDVYGGRLGRGKGYYDRFLAAIQGRIPLWGCAFSCQIYHGRLPIDHCDVPMDRIVTEDGFLPDKKGE